MFDTTKEIVGFILSLCALFGIGYKVYTWRRNKRKHNVEERRKNIEERKKYQGMLEAVTEQVGLISEGLEHITGELRANGGGSIRDIITDIRNQMAVDRTARRLTSDTATFEELINPDASTRVMFVSSMFVQMTGLTRDECEHDGWTRAIAPEDRDRVVRLSRSSCDDLSVFAAIYTVQNVFTGAKLTVEHTATPVINYKGVVIGWIHHLMPRPHLQA